MTFFQEQQQETEDLMQDTEDIRYKLSRFEHQRKQRQQNFEYKYPKVTMPVWMLPEKKQQQKLSKNLEFEEQMQRLDQQIQKL